MQVTLNPSSMIQQKRSAIMQKKAEYKTSVERSKQNFQLPGYNQVDRNFQKFNIRRPAFGSAANEKLLQEIVQLERELASLVKETADAAVQASKARISKVNSWDDVATRKVAESIAEKAGSQAKKEHVNRHNSVLRWLWHGQGDVEYNEAYYSKMEQHYHAPKREIERLEENLHVDRKVVELADANEAQKAMRRQEINAAIARNRRLISYQGLQDSVNDMLAAKGGVNSRIAGYQDVKDEIGTKFVQKLAKSKTDSATDVPGCVILYGPTGTGKTTLLNGIADQSKEHADVVDISALQGRPRFFENLRPILDDAKDRYTNTGKRTILLLNDAEQLLSINKSDAPGLGIKLDENDANMLEAYGNNTGNVATFKSMLDDIAQVPAKSEPKTSNKSAATFFVTTNYPHLIHPDILSREGKATKIAVGLASGHNLAEVLRFYFEKMNKVADTIKGLKHTPDHGEAIDGLAGITDKARANLKQMIATGTVDKLNVDHENMPYAQIAKGLNPSETQGAYSNDRLRVISQDAFKDYLEGNPVEDDYRSSFFRVMRNTRRDINPARMQKFNLIDQMIKDKPIDTNTLEELLLQRGMGLMAEKDANILKYHTAKIKAELNSLKEQEAKGTLSEAQIKRKLELEELKSKIDAGDKPEI